MCGSQGLPPAGPPPPPPPPASQPPTPNAFFATLSHWHLMTLSSLSTQHTLFHRLCRRTARRREAVALTA